MKTDPNVTFGNSVLVIEPGSEWFKLVQVSRGRGDVKCTKAVVRRSADVEPLMGPNFLKALGLGELAGELAVVCLPRQAVNVRLIDLPSGDHQEIADMVDLQIARQTPYSRDEIVFDYRLFRAEKEGYTRVMLVIAQTGLVRQKIRLLEDAGLSVGLVTTTTDGWVAALQAGKLAFAQQAAGAVAFLDVDITTSDLVVLNHGVPLFSRSVSVGANQLLAGDAPSRAKAIQEIGMALETFRNETPAVTIAVLALAGMAARKPALAQDLEAELKLEVVPVTGVDGMAYDLAGPQAGDVSLIGISCAASAPGELQINLMPDSVRLRKSVMTKARRLTIMGFLILAILGLLSLYVEGLVNRQEVYLQELGVMTKKTTAPAERLEAMRRKAGIVAERMTINMVPPRALVELFGLVPEGTAFTSIEIVEASQLVCRGTAESVADTVKLVNAMESSPLFQNVKSTRTVSGKDRTEFEIACELEKKRP
ncbi:MAG: pilus assembly protein PilM [bacterium]